MKPHVLINLQTLLWSGSGVGRCLHLLGFSCIDSTTAMNLYINMCPWKKKNIAPVSELRYLNQSCFVNRISTRVSWAFQWSTVVFYPSIWLDLTFNQEEKKQKNTFCCLNNYSRYLFETKTVCLICFLMAARSWSSPSVCAMHKRRPTARQRSTPVWRARGAESGGRFSRLPRSWQITATVIGIH